MQAKMPGILAITTCSSTGFNVYGRRMMQSWLKNWPVPLLVYVEGMFRPPVGANSRRMDSVQWHKDYLATKAPSPPSTTYRHDAKRFSFKTAAVIDAALGLHGTRYLVWVDADTYTHEVVSPGFVRELLPEGDEFISWLYREANYPECGFYVLDLEHPLMPAVMAKWRSLYETGELYQLPEWHDSWVLRWVLEQFPEIRPKSISGYGSRTNHPFINGPLGTVMDHLKGSRKRVGRSHKSERRISDDVAYWRR